MRSSSVGTAIMLVDFDDLQWVDGKTWKRTEGGMNSDGGEDSVDLSPVPVCCMHCEISI